MYKTLYAGIDEVATMNQASQGWCYCVLSQNVALELEENVKKEIFTTSSLTSFHGKKFNVSEKGEYKHFLEIIKAHLEKSEPSFGGCSFNSKNWNKEFYDFANNLFKEVLINVGVTEEEIFKFSKEVMPALLNLMFIFDNYGSKFTLKTFIDSDNLKKKLAGLKTPVVLKHLGGLPGEFGSIELLGMFYNKLRDYKFPATPKLEENGILVLKDRQSILIQAADVIGNFFLGHVLTILGHPSKKNTLKSEIFESVFKTGYTKEKLSETLELTVENKEFEINVEGQYFWRYGYLLNENLKG